MRIATLLFIVLTTFGGAASADRGGEGAKRVYRDAHPVVFDAALAAAKRERLEVVETDRAAGVVRLSNGPTFANWGERITVHVRALPGDFTEVEIVNKPIFEFLMFSPLWDQVLLARIDAELLPRDPD
jgi:hypothetical protein